MGTNSYTLVTWFFFSFGLRGLLKKMGEKKLWRAWLPGLRYYALGCGVDMDRDGARCGWLDFLTLALQILNVVYEKTGGVSERVEILLTLVQLVLAVTLLVYTIRLYLRVDQVMGVRRIWIVLWLFCSYLAVMILGYSKKYQPREDVKPAEEWKAGTAPADVPGAAAARIKPTDSGLSVNLRERSVRDFDKKRYLLKDIALNIPNGSLVLLLGGSGSGKTTFVNAVIGYEKADADVTLNGVNVYKDYDRVKYRIGFVPQQNLVRGTDTVEHTVDDAARLRLPANMKADSRGERIGEVMDVLGLTAGQEGLVAKKSGGQLRRISIAMELVVDPELFVLDEPDSGLDGVIAREIFGKLRSIADEGKIVIVITHTPDRVIDLFDKVIVLARDSGRVGRLAFYGSPQEAKEFFGKNSMEEIVMSVNSKDEGGEGRADEFVARYAELAAKAAEEATV